MGYMDSLNLGSITGAAGPAAAAFNPVTAIGSFAGEAASAWYSNRQAQARQHEAFDQSKWMASNKYQMQVKDMMAAGLNPMLATQSGAPMPSTPSPASVQKPDLINAMANATLASAQAAKLRQETDNLKLTSSNIQTEGVNLNTIGFRIQAEIEEIDQKIKTGKATQQEIEARRDLLRIQNKLGQQELDIKRPEQAASGLDAANYSAAATRVLEPLIKILQRIK
ncbi:MAG: DNA pilot protein [Microvirus sp.]|nr:MAG: DNA pilot protein [Microvirus sp.]